MAPEATLSLLTYQIFIIVISIFLELLSSMR